MNLRTSEKSGLIPILAILFAALLTLLASPIFTIDVEKINLKTTDVIEVSWEDAMSSCSALGPGWTLPSIYQLIAIYYLRSDIELIEKTDYWAHNSFAGYSFGLNTSLGITSFDKHADTDHFICVEEL